MGGTLCGKRMQRTGWRPGACTRTRTHALDVNAEPWNALSLQTWAVHTSSVVEYLVAMGLAFRLGNGWRNLPLAMLFLHTSSLCACTYHIFFNDAAVKPLVLLQAALTFFGNIALALAARSISKQHQRQRDGDSNTSYGLAQTSFDADDQCTKHAALFARSQLTGIEDLSDTVTQQPPSLVVIETACISFVSAAGIKYGELLFDWPLETPSMTLALPIVLIPAFLNGCKWLLSLSASKNLYTSSSKSTGADQ